MKAIRIAILLAIVAAVSTIFVQAYQIKELRRQRDRYKTNTESLMDGMTKYKTSDSLNAARVQGLELTLKEYKKWHEDDLTRIRTLIKDNELSQVASAHTSTQTKVITEVHDSIIYIKGDTIVARCIDVSEKYLELHGCATPDNKFEGEIRTKDYLTITESYKRKRFLGFLWWRRKRFGRDFDIVSSNPNTEITGFEVITISHK